MTFVVFYLIQLFIFILVFTFFYISNSQGVALFFIFINIIITSYFLIVKAKNNKSTFLLSTILCGFYIRVVLMFLDVYHVILLLHSGGDSESFHRVATNNAIQSSINGVWYTYTNYSDILSYIYMLCNSQRLVGQYLNVLLGMGVVYYIWLSCRELKISDKTIHLVVRIICFFPTAIILSSILLREAWIEFFVAYSLYYFIKWFKRGGSVYILVSIISVLYASYMHTGVLMIAIGYLIAYAFYNPKKKLIVKSVFNWLVVLVIAIVFSAFIFTESSFTNKFDKLQNLEEEIFLESLKVRSDAGSQYLAWIDVNNEWQLILFSPIKMFYFLFSPLPPEWRGINDFIAFLFDSLFYIFFIYVILKNYKYNKNGFSLLLNFLMISLLITVFVFSYGTSTAGTAMRHRCKIISVVLVAFAITRDKNASYLIHNNYLNNYKLLS